MQKHLLDKTSRKIGWETFDWLLTHQTGKRNFDQIVELNLIEPSHMIKSFEKLGNITSATFAQSFCKLTEDARTKKEIV